MKIAPMKWLMRFGMKGKASPQYVGPYESVGDVSYKLKFPFELALVHPMFRVSMLKKCICDPMAIFPLKVLGVNYILSYEYVLLEILDRKLRN